MSAVFVTLPDCSFTVNGASPHDSALITAGAQLLISANWSLITKFDGEFANGAQTAPAPASCAARVENEAIQLVTDAYHPLQRAR